MRAHFLVWWLMFSFLTTIHGICSDCDCEDLASKKECECCDMNTCNLTSHCPSSCSNGLRDKHETDVDCGGGTCSKCEPYKFCNADSDCDQLVSHAVHCVKSRTSSNMKCTVDYSPDNRMSLSDSVSDYFKDNTLLSILIVTFLVCCFLSLLSCILIKFVFKDPKRSGSSPSAAIIPDIQSPTRKKRERKDNCQPDVVFQWQCSACEQQNSGLISHCEKCNTINPKDQDFSENDHDVAFI